LRCTAWNYVVAVYETGGTMMMDRWTLSRSSTTNQLTAYRMFPSHSHVFFPSNGWTMIGHLVLDWSMLAMYFVTLGVDALIDGLCSNGLID